MTTHPYPAHLVTRMQLPGGEEIIIRPIRPEDAAIEKAFIAGLSEQARYFRFMQALHEVTPQMLARFTRIDYDREMALIAVTREDGEEREIGVARYIINPDGESCEFAIAVADAWSHRGIGTQLMQRLIGIARARGLRMMAGEVLSDNQPMLELARNLGFSITQGEGETHVMQVSLAL